MRNISAFSIFGMDETVSLRIVEIAAITLGGMLLYQVVFYFLRRWAKTKKYFLPSLLQKNIYLPGMLIIINVAALVSWALMVNYIPDRLFRGIRHGLFISFIVLFALLFIRAFIVIREVIFFRHKSDDPLGYSLRKVRTRYLLLQRALNFVVIILAIGAILMTFHQIRQIGTTLLASAGLVGIILGFAAQKSLGTLFAGIQVALTQPIRLEDVVVVEGQFGTIGEITLTYVVVNSWDGRRLVVPISYFLEETFENWTRVSPDVIAKVKIYTDYTLPVDEVRKEFVKWVESSPLWDKRNYGFLVTDAKDNTIELRATISAKNSGDAWDMECMIREKLITHIRENYPWALPRARVEYNPERPAVPVNVNNDGKQKV